MLEMDGGAALPARTRAAARALGTVLLAAGVAVVLVTLGLVVFPDAAAPAVAVSAPRRPPIIPPAVPPGAPEHLALWSYVEKVNRAWDNDWPTVIRFLEEFLTRYPTNPTARDALYAAYIEHGKRLRDSGDVAAARHWFQRAADFDDNRGEAYHFLDELDKQP
jgi:hypothetical protein